MELMKDQNTCVDTNECEDDGTCDHGNCTNLLNGEGFMCDCYDGFVKTVDGLSCEGKFIFFSILYLY